MRSAIDMMDQVRVMLLRVRVVLGMLAIGILLAGKPARAQESEAAVEPLREALVNSDARALMQHASERVEIALLSGGSVYSRGQAIYVVQRFFEKYPPEQVRFEHLSKSEGSRFVEGTYRTSHGRDFHFYLRLHRQRKHLKLHEIRVRDEPE